MTVGEATEPGDPLAARTLALGVLLRVEAGHVHADAALAAALAASALTSRDRAFASRLVYGTLAWQGRLDFQLARFATRDLGTLDPEVRGALRLGLYQLSLLDRVPAHAAVATSVELAKRAAPAATGFVNAVLRRAVRDRERLPLPDPVVDPTHHLAVAYSHPDWLVARWQARFGAAATRDLLAADNEAAPTTLRARSRERAALIMRLEAAGIGCTPGRFAPDAVHVEGTDPHALPGWGAGAFSVQSEASQLIALLLDPGAGMRILDACAAPGGKANHIAELTGDCGLIVALDHRRRGAKAVAATARRLGNRSVAALALDARAAGAALPRASFDRVLVDAPCSGLGTLRAHPEIRWRREPNDLDRLAERQREILEAVTPLVKPGGAIVYATCTMTEEENQGVVRAWLSAHPEARTRGRDSLPPAGGPRARRWRRSALHAAPSRRPRRVLRRARAAGLDHGRGHFGLVRVALRALEAGRISDGVVSPPRTIAPSVLAADFGRLDEEVKAVAAAGADWLHLDVMDGHFVPNLTIGPAIVGAIRRATSIPLDVHLMITDPARYAPRFIDAGANWVSIHGEVSPTASALLADIRARGAHPAMAINPETPIATVAEMLPELDMLLVMSVHPGFGGQVFIPETLPKLEEARRLRERLGAHYLIEVDGGITTENVGTAAAAGAEVIVAGTAIFGADDYATAIRAMRRK